jgi:hypothetical protein
MTDPTGPYLQAAIICERVLQEQDGAISAIRIIDRLTHFVQGPDVPDTLPPFQQRIALLVAFKSGAARGRHTIRLDLEKPSGEQAPLGQFPVHFEGEERGVNLVINTDFQPDQEGLYWFDVSLGDERLGSQRLTRMPLRVMYQPAPVGPPG